MIIEFPAPAKLMSMNDRSHWAVRAQLTAMWRRAAWVHSLQAVRRQGVQVPFGFSRVTVTLPVKSIRTRRDPSNLMLTVKAVVDGMVDAGLFVDDDATHVTIAEPSVWTSKSVVVEVLELV